MNEGKISVRYSKALFLTAKEKGKIDEVRDDMVYLLELTSNPEVKNLLSSPVIDNAIKRSALSALLKGAVGDLTINLALLSVNNGREEHLSGIARSYIDIADRFNGITKAKLTTATKVSPSISKRITDLVEKAFNTRLEMEEVIDHSITGGFMLKIEDIFIDGSVKSQLRRIEKELKEI